MHACCVGHLLAAGCRRRCLQLLLLLDEIDWMLPNASRT
jgi:hypothetical protein